MRQNGFDYIYTSRIDRMSCRWSSKGHATNHDTVHRSRKLTGWRGGRAYDTSPDERKTSGLSGEKSNYFLQAPRESQWSKSEAHLTTLKGPEMRDTKYRELQWQKDFPCRASDLNSLDTSSKDDQCDQLDRGLFEVSYDLSSKSLC